MLKVIPWDVWAAAVIAVVAVLLVAVSIFRRCYLS
jgi:hypothetical protein